MKNKKRAFITGISGMVGSHLAEFLFKNTDWDIIGMIRWRSPLDNLSDLIEHINNKNRISLVYADLRDHISVDKAVLDANPDYVFHLAAQSYPQTSFTAPLDTLDTNFTASLHLFYQERVYDHGTLHRNFGVVHLIATFNNTFIHVTDLSG